ncbi:MAG: hypothetical protein ACR2GH_02735 [Pseudonocardia sp.]
MSIPYGVVKARRTTGVILLVTGLATLLALVLAIGYLVTKPPEVRSISQGSGGAAPEYPAASVNPSGAASYSPTPGEQLASYYADDADELASVPDGYWVPQLASNQSGVDKQGTTWDEASILQDHLRRRTAYGETAALLNSNDFLTYTLKNYWVTVLPSLASSTPEPVLAWCDATGIDADHCIAKRLSRSSAYPGDNTRNRG